MCASVYVAVDDDHVKRGNASQSPTKQTVTSSPSSHKCATCTVMGAHGATLLA